jgi:PAS domain-containing protein
MFLIDEGGMLVFCNEGAELMLGRTLGELGVMTANEFAELVQIAGLDGEPMHRRDTPPGRAFYLREPAHQSMLVTSLDGVRKQVEVTAYPLFGRDEEMHGVLTVFWESKT